MGSWPDPLPMATTPSPAHGRDQAARQQEGRAEVDVEHPAPLGRLYLRHLAAQADAGVQDEQIQALSVVGAEPGDEVVYLGLFADVRLVVPVRPQAEQLPLGEGRQCRRLVAAPDGEGVRARFGQAAADGASDAARPARDQGILPRKVNRDHAVVSRSACTVCGVRPCGVAPK